MGRRFDTEHHENAAVKFYVRFCRKRNNQMTGIRGPRTSADYCRANAKIKEETSDTREETTRR